MTKEYQVVLTHHTRGEVGEHLIEALYRGIAQSFTPVDLEVPEVESHQAAASKLIALEIPKAELVGWGHGEEIGQFVFIFRNAEEST